MNFQHILTSLLKRIIACLLRLTDSSKLCDAVQFLFDFI